MKAKERAWPSPLFRLGLGTGANKSERSVVVKLCEPEELFYEWADL